jgi:hypothetical protein
MVARKTHGLTWLNEKLYVIGGFGTHGPIAECEAFDTASGRSTQLPSLPVPLSCCSVAMYRN